MHLSDGNLHTAQQLLHHIHTVSFVTTGSGRRYRLQRNATEPSKSRKTCTRCSCMVPGKLKEVLNSGVVFQLAQCVHHLYPQCCTTPSPRSLHAGHLRRHILIHACPTAPFLTSSRPMHLGPRERTSGTALGGLKRRVTQSIAVQTR